MGRATRCAGLSAREAEVAELYVDGRSYKEIARLLDISPGTVRTHLNAIYRKLEVTNRIELLRRLAGGSAGPAEELAPAPPPISERRQVTALFVDLEGSTALGASLDAEDMHGLLVAYRAAVMAQLERHGGHATGFPGDGVVACIGWPVAYEDGAERAVRAGLAIVRAVGGLQAPGGRRLAARVGIATGEIVVDRAPDGTEHLVGGALNLASRLQQVAGTGGVAIAASTRALVEGLFETEALGAQRLKGLPDPVPVFRVVREREAGSRFEARHGGMLTPLVGRDLELALLLERWQRACAGEGQAVLLAGEPGIGKSRLAAALVERVRGDGGIVLSYQTAPRHGDSPLWPVRQQMRAAAGIDETQPEAEQLQRLEALLRRAVDAPGTALPLVADLLGIAHVLPLPPMSASRRREALLEALIEQLAGLARRAPVLLLFEDLHWIDPSSLDLLQRSLGRIDEARVLALLTSRPEGMPPLPDWPHLTRISLGRLPRQAAARIAEHRAGATALDAGLLEAVLARSDGVPLYIEEMTAALVEGGVSAALPASLQDSLLARLDRLGSAREVAQSAAVIGREFDLDLLAAVVGSREKVEAAVERLVASGLVFRRGPRFAFKHALVQDAAYRSLLREPRAALHGRVAEALLGRFPAQVRDAPEMLAHHLERAGRVSAAIDYYAQAADLASHRAANREAARYLERALGLVRAQPAGRGRERREVALLTALGRVTVALEGHAAARTVEIYGRALATCRTAGLGARDEFPIVLGLTVQAAVSGDQQTALSLARRLHPLAAAAADPVFEVEACYGLGITRSWRGELAEARGQFEAGSRLYTVEQHPRHLAIFSQDPGVVCGCRGAMTHWYMGHAATAVRMLEAGLALARRLGHPFSLAYALTWRAILAVERGAHEEAGPAVDEIVAYAEEQGFPIWRTLGLASRGRFLLECGTPEEAVAALEQALVAIAETGTGVLAGHVLGFLGDALRLAGRPQDGLARTREAMAEIERGGSRWAEVEALRAMARCQLAVGGEREAAFATLEQALRVARRQQAHMLALRAALDLARLAADGGGRASARHELATCLDGLEEGEAVREVDEARALFRVLA